MATNIKYYLGSLDITIGEYQNRIRLLLVANSETQAYALLHQVAASYYGSGEEQLEDSGYYANGGELHTKPLGIKEIGAATFFELNGELMVKRAENVSLGTLEDASSEGFKALAKATVHALAARGVTVTQSKMLDALASGMGQKNWQVMNAKFNQAPIVEPLKDTSDFEGRDENKYALRTLFDAMAAGSAKVQFLGLTGTVESCTPTLLDTVDGLDEGILRIKTDKTLSNSVVSDQFVFEGHQFLHATVEGFTTIVLENGTRIVVELPETKWRANVCRTGYGFTDISVSARTAAEAEDLVLDKAGDHLYNEASADYEVDWVTPM